MSDASVGYSEYCRYAFDPEGEGAYPNDSDLAYLTWTTADNGDILVGIEGTTENAETTAFRAPGLFIADITVGGLSAVNLLTITYSDSQLTLSPVAGISIPKGTVIAVNDGMVTYRVLPLGTPETELDNLWPRATLYYTYGSVCQFTAMDEATAANDPVVSTEYYNLQGVRIAGEALHATFLRSGIYIVKKMHESGKAEASKIVIK